LLRNKPSSRTATLSYRCHLLSVLSTNFTQRLPNCNQERGFHILSCCKASSLSQARSLQSLDTPSVSSSWKERLRPRGLLRVGFEVELYAHRHNSTNLPTLDAGGQRARPAIGRALVAASMNSETAWWETRRVATIGSVASSSRQRVAQVVVCARKQTHAHSCTQSGSRPSYRYGRRCASRALVEVPDRVVKCLQFSYVITACITYLLDALQCLMAIV
jgi:hypothetical protein